MKTPTGTVAPIRQGKKIIGYHARITWREKGKRRERSESMIGASKNEAMDRCRMWRNRWIETGTIPLHNPPTPPPVTDAITFTDLALYFCERYARPAEYANEKKAAGMRSWKTSRGHVGQLNELLGMITLDELRYADLDDARETMSAEITRRGTKFSIASVNRAMSTCRRMLKVARQRGWMDRDPFTAGDPLIRKTLESSRERVMTREEEALILAQCGPKTKRLHLRYAIITAVECGMREGEIAPLQKEAGIVGEEGYEKPFVDWKRKMITVTWFYSKNGRRRFVPMTKRLVRELTEWRAMTSPDDPSMFGDPRTFDSAWRGACRKAKVKGLTFHDLKHTYVTRAIEAGVPPAIVSRIAGHLSQTERQIAAPMTERYINVYEAAAVDAAAKMDILSEAVN